MPEPMKVFASCIRGALIAGPSKRLISLDFAGIESRFTAWAAGEAWKLKAFRAQDDKTGPDTYTLAYARAFQVDPSAIKKDDPRRQVGKVMELSLGFEGGVGAFVTMTKTYGVKLNELADAAYAILPDDVREEAERFLHKRGDYGLGARTFVTIDSIKRLWRRQHSKIVQCWRDLDKAAVYAVSNPGKAYSIPNGKVKFLVKSPISPKHKWLYMRLPSGRCIKYFMPQIERGTVKCPDHDHEALICPTCDGAGYIDGDEEKVSYLGKDTKTQRWMRVGSYGGKWMENLAQGGSSDLLRNGMKKVRAAGYHTIMTVHDEDVSENDEEFGSLEEKRALMCDLPKWAEGLPLAAEGWIGKRYRK